METFVPKGNIYGPILPQFVLERKITLGAKIMYALLCNYAHGKDHCWPSHRTLATRLSCSVSSVKNYLSELVTSNLISITRGQCRSSVYHLLLPEELRGKEVKSDCPQPEIDCGEPNYGYINNLSKQSEEKNPPLPLPPTGAEPSSPPSMPDAPAARGVSPSAHDFESVWKIYPKQEAKGFALSAWRKLQRDCDLPPLNELLSALQRFMASDSWQREQGRFVPQLGNWLRGKRWLDPITPATAPVSQSSLGKSPASLAYEENEKRRREQQDPPSLRT